MKTGLSGAAVLELPGGLALDECRCLSRVVLRPLAGHEEEWLADTLQTPSAARVTRLLGSCMLSIDEQPVTTEIVRKLLVGDRDFLILQLRRLSLGDQLNAVLSCPECHAPMDIAFRVSEVQVEKRPQKTPSHSASIGNREVRFRLPTGGDQEDLADRDIDEAAEELLDRCMLSDGGRVLSIEERTLVVDEMERVAPQVDLGLDMVCPECSHSFATHLDTTAFFFDEVRVSSRQLLREVHTLAFYYHWNESDILDLPRGRRREYLELLNETLRQES